MGDNCLKYNLAILHQLKYCEIYMHCRLALKDVSYIENSVWLAFIFTGSLKAFIFDCIDSNAVKYTSI